MRIGRIALTDRWCAIAVGTNGSVTAGRALRMVRDQQVVAVDGRVIHVTAETICVHGDTAGAVQMARRLRETFDAAGIAISARR